MKPEAFQLATQDISKQFNQLRNSFRKELRESVNDIRLDALYQQLLMQHVFQRPEPLAAMTSWSVAPEFAWWLFQHVTTTRPGKIIELGSGTSTLVIAAALKQLGVGRFLSFEHDHAYLEKTRALLQVCDLQDHVELIYAPLEEMQLEGLAYRWYDLPYDLIDHMIGREGLDLLLVDGPPAATNYHARYPALARLRDYCSESTLVLLDDAGREEEQEILGRWGETLEGECSHQMLSNVRHGPALFQFTKTPMAPNGCEEASMRAAGGSVWQEIEQQVKNALHGVQRGQDDGLVRSLLDSFLRFREYSLEALKVKTAEVSVQCKTFEKEVVSLKQQLADEKLRLSEHNRLLEDTVRASDKEQQTIKDALGAQKHINDKLSQDLKDAKKQLNSLAHERNALRTELRNLVKQHKLVYKSLVYQLGMATYRQTRSVGGWLKIPLAIKRVMRRHAASGNPDIVELQSHDLQSSENKRKATVVKELHKASDFNLAACSEALQKIIQRTNSNSVLWVASHISNEQGYESALKFAEDNAGANQKLGLNILRANSCLQSDGEWLRHVNAYLAGFQLVPVDLSAAGGSRFSRLCVTERLTSMEGPLITVIMPAYNSEGTIRHAANSILQQTWRNLELIIVDDCSTDSTWDMAQQLAKEDGRVVALRNPANVGPYVSKNLALRLAKGRYITGHDADDWAHPQRIELQLLSSEKLGSKAALTRMLRVDLEGKFTSFSKQGDVSPDGCRRTAYISCFFDADFLKEKLGGWDTVRFGADSEIIKRSEVLLGSKLDVVDCVAMFCLDSQTGLTRHPEFGIQVGGEGLSPVRKEYVSIWGQWHSKLISTPDSAVMPFPHRGEKYIPPAEMQVDKKDLARVLDEAPVPIAAKKIVVFVYNDSFMRKVLAKRGGINFDMSFFSSDLWPARPNSTSRLNICNYQAASLAFDPGEFEIKHLYFESFDGAVVDALDGADVVVVHQVASVKSKEFITRFVKYWRDRVVPFKLIFGTEMSWGNELAKGMLEKDVVDYVYRKSVLLRHTPKTDRFFYNAEEKAGGSVCEFDLGVDTDLLCFGLPVEQRKYITFVRAPEGRKIKNNSLIDILIDLVNESPALDRFEIKIMNPPYSSIDYWRVMAQSAFFIITSDSETFSYALNDARALGAVSFHPAHMYSCGFGWCQVESYPDSPHKYADCNELISNMEKIASDMDLLRFESQKSRDYVVRNFSLQRLAANWLALIEGRLADQTLLVVGGRDRFDNVSDLLAECSRLGANYALLYLNEFGFDFGERSSFYDEECGVTLVRYYLERDEGGRLVYATNKSRASESKTEMEVYFELIKRMYRIKNVVVSEDLFERDLLSSVLR